MNSSMQNMQVNSGIKCSKNCPFRNPIQPQSGTFQCLGSSNARPCDGTYNVTPEQVYAWKLYVDQNVPQLASSNAALRQQGYTVLFMKTDESGFTAEHIEHA